MQGAETYILRPIFFFYLLEILRDLCMKKESNFQKKVGWSFVETYDQRKGEWKIYIFI